MRIIFFHLTLLFLPFLLLSQPEFKEICLSNHSSNDRYASYSPSGDSILFESDRSGKWEIYLLILKNQQTVPLLPNESNKRRPSWSPDGKKVVFETDGLAGNQLMELELANGQLRTVLKSEAVGGELMFAKYSPDGKQMTFSIMESSKVSNIGLLDLHSGIWTTIADLQFRSTFPNWAPNGKSIIFHSRRDTDNEDDEIYRYYLRSKKLKRLTNWPKHNFCPAFSPKGNKIAYVTSMEGIRPELYIMDKNGKQAKRITENQDGDTLPNWSPDGKKLVFTAFRGDNFEICEIELD